MVGRIVINEHPEQHYKTLFNQNTGFFVRIEDKGYDEPTWAMHGPELLDISITNYCKKGCDFCYRNSSIYGQHIAMSDMELVVAQAKEIGVSQIALGGGNPNEHPYFIEILKLIRDNDIIPSYTTNGDGLTEDILKATSDYCGAIAISAYPPFNALFENKLKLIKSLNIKTNLHYILKSDTIELATEWLKKPPSFFKYVNAIIFLNYKPINSSARYQVTDSKVIKSFFEAAQECKVIKVGFDSCSVSGIVEYMNVNSAFIESCEAARFSAFISEDMKMYPCSFMANTECYGDLKKGSMHNIWKSNIHFTNHRKKIFNNTCTQCSYNKSCNGGCVFLPDINLCSYSL